MSDAAIGLLESLLIDLQKNTPRGDPSSASPPNTPKAAVRELESAYGRAQREEALIRTYISLLETVVARTRNRLPAGEALASLEQWTKAHPALRFVSYPEYY